MSTPKRLPEFTYTGPNRYFLTFCTLRRAPHLTAADNVQPLLAQFLQCSAAADMDVTAYCAMPDHVHLLVTGLTDTADLRAFAARAKQTTSFAFKRRHGERLWQVGYYERILRESEPTWLVARYIINNPVRAGLVDAPEDYPWWGSQSHTRAELLEFLMFGGDDDRPW